MAGLMPLVQATIGGLLALLGIVIAGLLALLGIAIKEAWTTRRDYRKRRVDLAEEVLALCHEAEEAIRSIRSPAVWAGEGGTRQRRESERPEESAALDRAYIVIERYNKYDQAFKNLKAKKYMFMAAFRGEDARRPFELIDQVMVKLRLASNALGEYYWQNMSQMREFAPDQRDRFLKAMEEQQAVFLAGSEPDPVTPVVTEAVQMVEAITDRAAKEYVAEFTGGWPGLKSLLIRKANG
ncbi:MAG: hypothetical protein ACLP7Q_16925 [Isosphaeraceae bacterium]